jgi:methylase of polypeptide subunit release factors
LERHRKVRYPYHCTFGKAELQIDEDVFCPSFTQTSSLLLESIEFRPGQRVLDVFAGSGALAINAALAGASTVAVDVSAAAVACARRNAILNRVADNVDVRWGTMQDCVDCHETFDVIVANPPLLPGPQSNLLSAAIFDPQFRSTINFLQRISRHLKGNSLCYLLTSNVIERLDISIDSQCMKNGLEASLIEKLDVGYESYRVHKIRLHY